MRVSLFNHKQDKTLYSNKVFNIHKNIIENNREFYKKMPKFLLKHNYNKYYSIHNSDNIDFVVSVFNNKSNYNLGQQKYKKDIKKINKIGNGNLWLIQNAAISFMNN